MHDEIPIVTHDFYRVKLVDILNGFNIDPHKFYEDERRSVAYLESQLSFPVKIVGTRKPGKACPHSPTPFSLFHFVLCYIYICISVLLLSDDQTKVRCGFMFSQFVHYFFTTPIPCRLFPLTHL